MPYVSDRQRRYMHAKLPSIAARWDKQYGGKIKPKKKSKEGFLSMLTTKQESLDQKASKIRKAVYDELRPAPQPMMSESGYIRDVYEDHVIYSEGEHDWKVPFTTDAEGDLEVAPRDEWTEVEQTWTEVKALRDFVVALKQITLKRSWARDQLGRFASKVGGSLRASAQRSRGAALSKVIVGIGQRKKRGKPVLKVTSFSKFDRALNVGRKREALAGIVERFREVAPYSLATFKTKGKRGAKAPLGQGGRFAALEAKIASRGKVSNPAAVAAAIGRNKYGAGRMAKLSAQGRKHKEMETTFKFNRAHDKLGRFAKKVGGIVRGAGRVSSRVAGGVVNVGLLPHKIAAQGVVGLIKSGPALAEKVGISRLGRAAGRMAKPSAAHRARKAAGVAALKKGVGKVGGLLARSRGARLLRTARRPVSGSVRAIGKVRTAVKRGIGRTVRHVGPGAKLAIRIAKHRGPGISKKWLGMTLRKEFQIPMTSFVFKGADDSYRWVLLSSNGFRDKDGEIVSTKALQQDVAQWELAGSPTQPLRFWHIPLTEDYSRGLEIGTCDFRMVNGHTLIESGTFLTKEIGEAVYGAQDKLAASLGFRHSPFEPDSDKIFNTIRTFERSLLPKESASNSLTYLAAYAPQGV